jgi:hypothetical protein
MEHSLASFVTLFLCSLAAIRYPRRSLADGSRHPAHELCTTRSMPSKRRLDLCLIVLNNTSETDVLGSTIVRTEDWEEDDEPSLAKSSRSLKVQLYVDFGRE